MHENFHNPLDKFFRDAIQRLSEKPGKKIWENIEQQLDKNSAENYKRKYFIYKGLAVSLLFLLLSYATFNLFNYNKLKNETKSVAMIDKRATRTQTVNSSASNNYSATIRHEDGHVTVPYFISKKRPGLNPGDRFSSRNTDDKIPAELFSSKSSGPTRVSNIVFASTTNTKPDAGTEIKLPAFKYDIPSATNNSAERSAAISKKIKEKNRLLHRFFVTAFIAPEFANYKLKDDEINHYENKRVIQEREKNLFSYEIGFLASYALNKKISLQSGLTWSSSNINIDPDKIYAVKNKSGSIVYEYNTSSGYGYILPSFSVTPVIGDSLYTRTSVHKLEFLTIPLLARYKFDHKKYSVDPGIGIAVNLLTKANLKTEVNDDTESEIEFITKLKGLKKISYSFLLSSDFRYKVSKKWSLVISPYLKYALAPVNNGGVVKTYPYNLGGSVGVMTSP
jgi:hypothetical protein